MGLNMTSTDWLDLQKPRLLDVGLMKYLAGIMGQKQTPDMGGLGQAFDSFMTGAPMQMGGGGIMPQGGNFRSGLNLSKASTGADLKTKFASEDASNRLGLAGRIGSLGSDAMSFTSLWDQLKARDSDLPMWERSLFAGMGSV